MAPIKPAIRPLINNENNCAASKVIGLRRAITRNTVLPAKDPRPKRKANSPLKSTKDVKQIDMGTRRAAFGDITNAVTQNTNATAKSLGVAKKVTVQAKVLPVVRNDAKVLTRGQSVVVKDGKNPKLVQVKRTASLKTSANKVVKPRYVDPGSESSAKSEDSLYVSALEETPPIVPASPTLDKFADEIALKLDISPDQYQIPDGVKDFDSENAHDLYANSAYAMDIFNYLKTREPYFQIPDYIKKQKEINPYMRALLVDWMVEVQESFELNHETLYLAVKLLDRYLSVVVVNKDMLQLVGSAALFIACKYDERVPPVLDDFLYICDGAYSKKQMFQMEINILKKNNFELGFPLSYRFLRRYARVSKISLPTLTLARFLLEYSLMDYNTVCRSDSKMAAAALYIALKMEKISEWTPTLEYYSGYKLDEFMFEVKLINEFHHKPTPYKDTMKTVRTKYSHEVFFKVATKKLLTNEEL